jgi:hypothetical protein
VARVDQHIRAHECAGRPRGQEARRRLHPLLAIGLARLRIAVA